MGPSEGRDVCQKIGRTVQSSAAAPCDGFAKVLSVPVYDDCGEQVESGHTEVLSFGCLVADFTSASDAQGILESVMCLSLVEADLGGTLHVGVKQPIDDEQRPVNSSDFPAKRPQARVARDTRQIYARAGLGALPLTPWWPRCAGCQASSS